MLRPLKGRHALRELGVSLGWFRPLRDQRLQEPALSGFLFEANTRGEFRACRTEVVAPAVGAIGICCSYEVNEGSVRRSSLCESNVCGKSETRIVAAVSAAITAQCSDGRIRLRSVATVSNVSLVEFRPRTSTEVCCDRPRSPVVRACGAAGGLRAMLRHNSSCTGPPGVGDV
jgi:hypothetical protein